MDRPFMLKKTHIAAIAGVLALAYILGSATLVPRSTLNGQGAVPAADGPSPSAARAQPAAMALEMWDTKVLPYLDARAADFATVRAAMAGDLEAAGRQYGQRAAGDDAPWHFVVRLRASVLAVNADAVLPRLTVDTNGDGAADATVQCGPIIEGAALRDALDFIGFATFDSQIAYGEFGTALNDLAHARVSKQACADAVPGRELAMTGTFTHRAAALPDLTAVRWTWGDAR